MQIETHPHLNGLFRCPFNSKIHFDLRKIYDIIISHEKPQCINYIGVFGSFVCPRKKRVPTKKYLFGLYEIGEHEIDLPPNDIDILVLTTTAYKDRFTHNISFDIVDYNGRWDKQLKKNGLHLTFISESDWFLALETEDSFVTKINSQLTTLYERQNNAEPTLRQL
jgi:hypothetical protein